MTELEVASPHHLEEIELYGAGGRLFWKNYFHIYCRILKLGEIYFIQTVIEKENAFYGILAKLSSSLRVRRFGGWGRGPVELLSI